MSDIKITPSKEFFNVPEKRADEILDTLMKYHKTLHDWTEIVKKARKDLKLKSEGEKGYFGYVLGSMVTLHKEKETFVNHFMEALLCCKE